MFYTCIPLVDQALRIQADRNKFFNSHDYLLDSLKILNYSSLSKHLSKLLAP